ncbi:MAG: hypothetical protein AAYR33_06530 [Acetobacteraceae bacterium]
MSNLHSLILHLSDVGTLDGCIVSPSTSVKKAMRLADCCLPQS